MMKLRFIGVRLRDWFGSPVTMDKVMHVFTYGTWYAVLASCVLGLLTPFLHNPWLMFTDALIWYLIKLGCVTFILFGLLHGMVKEKPDDKRE